MDMDMARANYWMRVASVAALGVLALFLLVATFGTLKYMRFIGSGVAATNTISVEGHGEVTAVPDIATFSVTVREKAKDVSAAQTTATSKSNSIVAYLKEQGIADKDIQTTSYNVYPQYDYVQAACSGGICPPGRQVLSGYEVSQTITVKVRDTKKAGEILAGVGSRGASEVSGLSFAIDKEDDLKMQARQKAIDSAEEKAKALARQLHVELVRIVGFSENGAVPPPYAYARGDAMGVVVTESKTAPTPELPTGENKITSNVSITYEIR